MPATLEAQETVFTCHLWSFPAAVPTLWYCHCSWRGEMLCIQIAVSFHSSRVCRKWHASLIRLLCLSAVDLPTAAWHPATFKFSACPWACPSLLMSVGESQPCMQNWQRTQLPLWAQTYREIHSYSAEEWHCRLCFFNHRWDTVAVSGPAGFGTLSSQGKL